MRTIHKYPLQGLIGMPQGAEILDVQVQDEVPVPVLWAMIENTNSIEARYFEIIGTGDFIDPARNLSYIGTYQDGSFVWHVFETNEK